MVSPAHQLPASQEGGMMWSRGGRGGRGEGKRMKEKKWEVIKSDGGKKGGDRK